MEMIGSIIYLAVIVFIIAAQWKIYEKAEQPGWACIIPFYNIIVLLNIIKKPGIWLLYMFIPFVNIVILFKIHIALAHKFGKGTGFGVGLALLGFIFLPILGFGDAEYQDGLNEKLNEFGTSAV